ncbi:MAG: VTT domain-containing protein [Pseudomonadota bacterium]
MNTAQSTSRWNARTMWSAGLSVLFVLAVLFLLLFGRGFVDLDRDGIDAFLTAAKESPWGFLAVALLYTALALTGFPQALLFAGTAAVFGGPLGALYSWMATMISSAVTFALGRIFGGFWVKRISADRAQAIVRVMQNRGVLASMIVRWTPSAPFIVVNAICGSSGMKYWKFATGTGLGIMPKIAIIAFFTDQIDEAARFLTSGDPKALITLGILAVLWVLFILGCRVLYQRLKGSDFAGLAPQTAIPEETSVKSSESAQKP